MKHVISILKFVNNVMSGENISLGLVAISNGKVFFRVSNQKLQLARKLNSKNAKLLDFSIKQLDGYLSHDLESGTDNMNEFKGHLNSIVLDRLSKYNNGLLQFSAPSAMESEISQSDFYSYFDRFIGKDEVQVQDSEDSQIPSKLINNIETKFIAPLANRIDLNLTIKKKQLPSLFFDFAVDGLGVNGSLYVVKSLDLNVIKPSTAKANISEYESLLDRLIDFSKAKGVTGDPMTYLIMDVPEKGKSEIQDLYRYLINEKMKYFRVISSDTLSQVTSEIIYQNARKFSQDLLPSE
jgi:hypothetical protein